GNSDIYGIADDSATWTGTDRYGRDIQTGRGESRDVTAPGGAPSVVHPNNLIGSRSHSPERDVVLHRQAAADERPEQAAQPEQDPAGNGPAGNTNPEHTNTDGGSAMSQSGEITDLPSAIAYCQSTASYCDQITSTFE